MTIKKMAQIGVAAAAATLLALPLAGCGATNAALTLLNGGACKPGPTVFLVADVSGSTTALRQPGGLYTTTVEAAVTGTAKACGSLYAGRVEGNGLNTTWTIDGKEFRQTIGGNDALGAAARAEKAKRDVFPKISALLTTRHTPGTDLLGVMSRVSDAAASLPAGSAPPVDADPADRRRAQPARRLLALHHADRDAGRAPGLHRETEGLRRDPEPRPGSTSTCRDSASA